VKDRQWVINLDERTRIVVRRSSAHPFEYAVVLVRDHQGSEYAVVALDNAHNASEHHEHRYIGTEKQPPAIMSGRVNDVMHRAISRLRRDWRALVAEWEETIDGDRD
jgi:hypothetical protein